MEKKPYRRRHYFINRNFQGRFILSFILMASLGVIVSIGLFNILAYRKLDRLMYSIHIPARNINELLSTDLIYATIIAFLLVLTVLFIAIKRLTLRVAGPLYRIRKDLETIADGDLSFNITLRYRDEFKDFAEELNRLVGSQRDLFNHVRKEIETADQYTREAERYYPKRDVVAEKAGQIVKHLEKLEGDMSRIRL